MTNRTPQEIVKAALERWDEYSHTPSSRLTSMDWEMLEESFLKGIQAALEADRNARVLVVPDRETFKRDLGLKNEPKGSSYNKGVMDAYDTLVHIIKCSTDRLEPQVFSLVPSDKEIHDLAVRHCEYLMNPKYVAPFVAAKRAYEAGYRTALQSQRTIGEDVLREVEEALEFYGSYSTYKNNVGKKYSPSLGLDVPHGPAWSAIGKDKGTAAQKALKSLRDAVRGEG